jgi:hypothetical protein
MPSRVLLATAKTGGGNNLLIPFFVFLLTRWFHYLSLIPLEENQPVSQSTPPTPTPPFKNVRGDLSQVFVLFLFTTWRPNCFLQLSKLISRRG